MQMLKIATASTLLLIGQLAMCNMAQAQNNAQSTDEIFTGYDKNGYPTDEPRRSGKFFSGGSSINIPGYYRKKVAQWGDPLTPPMTRTRCIGYASGDWPWGGGWKTCNQWATDTKTMQVELFVVFDTEQTAQDVENAVRDSIEHCMTVAVGAGASAVYATPSPEPAARLSAGYLAAKAAFAACLTAEKDKLPANVLKAIDKLKFEQSTHWSKWSNE